MKRSLKITERQVNGKMYYRVRGTLNGKRYESTFKDLEFAEEWKDTREAEAKTNGMNAHFTWLTRKQINEAEVSFNRLGNRSLSEAIDYFLKNYNPATNCKGLVDAYIEFLGSRENANARPLTINNLRLRVGALVGGHPEMDAHEVTVTDVKAFLAKPGWSAVSVSNYRRALHAFFNWCVKQEYCSQNPVAKIEPVKVDRDEPAILTFDQCETLVEKAALYNDGIVLPYVALGLFAGIRPKEIQMLKWRDIDLEEKLITISSKISKTRERRHVDISDNLLAWLLPCFTRNLVIYPDQWRKHFDEVKKLAEIKEWKQDLLRHTYISFHLAKHKHEGKTAEQAGNSPIVIFTHYRNLVKPKDAENFWEIFPAPNLFEVAEQNRAS